MEPHVPSPHVLDSSFFPPVLWNARVPDGVGPLYDWHRTYVCPVCGSAWARWTFPNREFYTTVCRGCPIHRAFHSERAGSLIVDLRIDLLLLPPVLLTREFRLLYDY